MTWVLQTNSKLEGVPVITANALDVARFVVPDVSD